MEYTFCDQLAMFRSDLICFHLHSVLASVEQKHALNQLAFGLILSLRDEPSVLMQQECDMKRDYIKLGLRQQKNWSEERQTQYLLFFYHFHLINKHCNKPSSQIHHHIWIPSFGFIFECFYSVFLRTLWTSDPILQGNPFNELSFCV